MSRDPQMSDEHPPTLKSEEPHYGLFPVEGVAASAG